MNGAVTREISLQDAVCLEGYETAPIDDHKWARVHRLPSGQLVIEGGGDTALLIG